ncbi:MAG: hypothetical protein JKY92_04195 [Magnetovibrio sp.]|nr:hypothetical protein [Magnetovibrio sp.]
MSGNSNVDDKHWHLDRRVPIAMIVALLIQFASGAWYMHGLTDGVDNNKSDIAEIKKLVDQTRTAENQISHRMIAVETQLKANNRILERLERHLLRVPDK